MNDIYEIKRDMVKLKKQICILMEKTEYDRYGDLSAIDRGNLTAEERFLKDCFAEIMDELDNVSGRIDYIEKPIKCEGRLQIQSDGRFHLANRILTCGSRLEILVSDDYGQRWEIRRIEHDGVHYYAAGSQSVQLDGITARIR